MRRITLLVTLIFLLVASGAAMAQQKDNLNGDRLGPEDFGPFGEMGECYVIPTNIPDDDPTGVTMTLDIPCQGQPAIDDLDVSLQISHTWVGDVSIQLTKVGGATGAIFDRPGYIDAGFGCSGDDIDAVLDDEAALPVEDECAAAVPTISGEFIAGDPPDNTLLSAWDGEAQCGTWELNVSDHFDGDTGVVFGWCVIFNSADAVYRVDDGGDDGGGDDGGGVPASTGIGIALLLLVLFGSSVYFLRRRATN